MPKLACPDVKRFQELALNRLTEADKQDLLGHLESCDACAQKLDSLPSSDTLADLLREGVQTDAAAKSRQAINALIERLSKLRPGESSTSETPTSPPAAALWTFACPGCGKQGKVKRELAGKKVRCPRCRRVVLLPSAARAASEERTPRLNGPTISLDSRTPVPEKSGATVGTKGPDLTSRAAYGFLAPAEQADELGRLGPYRVLEVLGAGGMGIVFRAEDPHLKRFVALKVLQPDLAARGKAHERFLREARAAAAIKHDHIVAVYQVGEDRGIPYLAMEFLEGEPLDARLARESKLPLPELLRIGRDIALGLAAAHQRGLIHRDIKPANIWLEVVSGGVVSGRAVAESSYHSPLTTHHSPTATRQAPHRVKILDFGLARPTDEEARLTQIGAIMGTPAYMAPEQAQGKEVDYRCDLFSLGCVLYRMATGEAPFKGTDTVSILLAVATDTPQPPRELEPSLPAALADLILSLLAKDPDQRPPSAHAAADTIDQIAQATHTRLPKPGRLRKSWLAAAGFALLGFILAMSAAGILRGRTSDGILVVKVNEPHAEVYVDGQQVTVTWGDDGKQAEVPVSPGTHTIEVKKDGFAAVSGEAAVKGGMREIFHADLLPHPETTTDLGAERSWISLTASGLAEWRQEGDDWQVGGGVDLDPNDNNRFIVRPGSGVLYSLAAGKGARNLLSRREFGDLELQAEFMVPPKGNSGIFFLSHYELQIEDSWGATKPGVGDCGGLFPCRLDGRPLVGHGCAPRANASLPPGQWQKFEAHFQAPRFDADGRLLSPARFSRVVHNGKIIHYKAEVTSPDPKTAPAPLLLQGGFGPVAFRNIRVRASNTGSLPPARVTAFLSELPYVSKRHNWQFTTNGVVFGRKVQIEGKESPHGILLHPADRNYAEVVYNLHGNWTMFEGGVAVPRIGDGAEKKGIGSPQTFEIIGDHSILWTSKAVKEFGTPQWFRVDVSRVQVLRLRVHCPGDARCARTFWIEPRLTAGMTQTRGAKAALSEPLLLHAYHGHEAPVVRLLFTPDEKSVISAGNGDHVRWDGKLEIGVMGNDVRVWSVESGEQVRYFPTHEGYHYGAQALALTPDGNLLAAAASWPRGQSDSRVYVWDLRTGKRTHHFNIGGASTLRGVGFSSDGKTLFAVQGEHKRIHSWSLEDSTSLPDIGLDETIPGLFPRMTVTSDGRYLLGGIGTKGDFRIWDLTTGKIDRTFRGHKKTPTAVVMSPDQKHVLSASGDLSICLWDRESGQQLLSVDNLEREVLSLAFAPDGRRFVTGGADSSVVVRDTETGKELAWLPGHKGKVNSVAFSPSGRLVASGGDDKIVRVWRLPPR